MMQLALKDARLIPSEGADTISGDALAELARQYVLADGVIARLGRFMDVPTPSAIVGGVTIALDTEAQAQEAVLRPAGGIARPDAATRCRSDVRVFCAFRKIPPGHPA